ncbi:PREDICTED: TSC22 domain family protein 1-like isoform X2 [Hipposideros armiger]|uniref:TSC22 domain family protein 1-like isoform X2 n=1 Tax=Hipposideros armiger TaxID=186990 RepID=A0A8B7RY95_HIPAR|nr:PREDICTED: TSC22 domain family protein 1-like isoform X2 [Hipposideros armiger]
MERSLGSRCHRRRRVPAVLREDPVSPRARPRLVAGLTVPGAPPPPRSEPRRPSRGQRFLPEQPPRAQGLALEGRNGRRLRLRRRRRRNRAGRSVGSRFPPRRPEYKDYGAEGNCPRLLRPPVPNTMHQPPESAAAAAAAADISARKMAHPALFPRRGSGSGSASALSAAGTSVGSHAPSSEDFPPPSLLQPPPPAASSTSGPQPPPPQSLNLLSQAQLQAQPLAPGGTQMKKKSGFQITSVTPAQISASMSSNNSIAEDTESYDDLDESHTEDLSSSEILDVSLSRATDLGEPERSSSEETLNNFQEAETPGAVSPNQPHLPHLAQQNVVINGNAHPHHLHHHHHMHHGHHLHHGHHHPSHAGVASPSIPGGPPSSPASRKLSTTGSSDSVIPAAPTSAVSSGGLPASVMTNVRAVSATGGSIGINSVTGTNTVNNVNLTAVGSFNPSVTSSMPGNANVNPSNIPSAASGSVGPGVSSSVNVNTLSGMANGTISSSAVVNTSVPNAAAGMTVGSVSSQQQQPTVNTSRFRVVKLDSSSEPFKKGRWTCTEFYEKENAAPATEGVAINKAVETVKQNPTDVTSERESTSGSSVSSSVSTLSHYTESVGSGEMGAPTVVVQQPALPGAGLPQMDFSSTGPPGVPAVSTAQSIPPPHLSQVQLQSQELSYQQKQGVQPVPVQATLNAATGIQPSPVNVVGVTSALGQQPSIASLAQPQLPYPQTAPPLQAPLPGAPPQQLQYGQPQSTVSTQMAPVHGTSVTPIPPSEYVQQPPPPTLPSAVSTGQPAPAGVGTGAAVIPMAQPQSVQLPVQPTTIQAPPSGAPGQPVAQAPTAVPAVPPGSQIANIGHQANVPTAVQQPSSQVTPSVIQQGAPPSSQIVPPAQTAIIHQGVQTSASSLPQQLVIAPQNTLVTVPPQPPGVEPVAQGVVLQQLPALSPLPSASSISVTNQVSSTGPGMPSAPTNLVPPQNIAQSPATQNGNVVQSVSQPPSIATNINLPLAQQMSLSSTQSSAQSLAQAIGGQVEDARRPAEPSLVGLPQTISGDSGGMSAVSDGSSSSLAASASLFPLKVLPLTTPLVDGEDESASLLPEVQGVILEPQIQPRPRRAFDVRGPLSPLNPWRQNIQLLERVGKDNKQISFNW